MSSPDAQQPEGIDFRRMQLDGDPSSSISARLRGALATCSKCLEAGDYVGSDKAISELVDLLNDVAESPPSVSGNAVSREALSEEALAEVHGFLSSPSADQVTVDALSLELPKVVVRFTGVSDKCREFVEKIIDSLIATCNPRDMLSMLCEALYSQMKVSTTPTDFVILLKGLSRVFVYIKRHHVQQVKESLPVVLNVVQTVASEFDGEDEVSLHDFFRSVITVAESIQSVCEKMVGERKEELCAILSLYALQSMAFLSMSNLANKVSNCVSFAMKLSRFLPFCGLTYLGLITGCDIESVTKAVCREDGDDFIFCFSSVKDGASLAVLWGSLSDEVAKAAGEQLETVVDELRRDRTKRWQAVGMLKYVFWSTKYPWKIQAQSIEFLSSIMDGIIREEYGDDCTGKSFLIPRIFTALQALEKVIMFAPDATLRQEAFSALRHILSALNLYKFILMRESTGKIGQTRVLTEMNLQKAYTEWLLPLRTLVSGIEAENKEDNDELAFHTLCALNPVQFVLYDCIELVEGYL
uniref:Aberrant root formation protein 4 n=1 Tax=Anthurium amnicola TaxID=1678845 RepID=A0A1D1XG73_9ARAE